MPETWQGASGRPQGGSELIDLVRNSPAKPYVVGVINIGIEPTAHQRLLPEEPETRDPGPSPPSLHPPHPGLSFDPAVRYPVGGEIQQLVLGDGGYGSPVPDLGTSEESDLTNETDLNSSTKDSPTTSYGHLLQMDSVWDLRDNTLRPEAI